MSELQQQSNIPFGKKWCPWGRISFQRATLEGMEVLPGGAFNAALDCSDNKFSWRSTAKCVGPDCPYYHPPLLLYRNAWGRCGLERRHGAVCISLLLSAAAVAGAVLLRGGL